MIMAGQGILTIGRGLARLFLPTISLWVFTRDFLDVHIAAQLEAKPGSTFHGLTGQQNEEIVLLGNYHGVFSFRH